MVCKTTSTDRQGAAFTLVESMVATVLGLLLTTAVVSVWIYANRSFAAIGNYLDLDKQDQLALDKTSREIRQVSSISNLIGATNITFIDYDGIPLQYYYDANAKTLLRLKSGKLTTNLTGC